MSERYPSDYVSVRFEPDDDGTGKLVVSASAHGFAGRGSAWFDVPSIIEFASLLGAYPLGDPPPVIAGGIWGEQELEEEHVRLEARRIGSRGEIALLIHLSSEVWSTGGVVGSQHVRLQLHTTYERVRPFTLDLQRVVAGELNEARLDGE